MTEYAFAPTIATAWQPAPYALVRLAGASYAELERLKFAQTLPLLRELLAGRKRVAALRETAADALYAAIGTVEGSARSQLVALRRNIFNGRPLARERLARLRADAPHEVRAAVLRYNRQWAILARLERTARATFEAELVAKRVLLQESFSAPEFQKGVQVASPAVFEGLRQYLRADPAALRGRERRVEIGLYKYLVRMAAKTSPFSRFGPTLLAQYDPSAPQALALPPTKPAVLSFSELQLSLVAALIDVVRLDPAVRGRLRLLLNPSLYASGGELVLARVYTPILRPLKGANLRRSPYIAPLRALIEFWRAGSADHWTLDGFVDAYTAASGLARSTVVTLVDRLVTAQALLLDLPIASDHPDRLGALLEVLRSWNDPHLARFSQRVAAVRDAVTDFGAADVPARQTILRLLHEELAALLADYPLASRVRSDLEHALVEDVTLADTLPTLGHDFFAPFIDDLSALLDCVYARDQGSLGRSAIYDTFLAAHGPGASGVDPQQFVVEQLGPAINTAHVEARATNQFLPVDDGRPRVNAANRRLRTYLATLNGWLDADRTRAEVQLPRTELLRMAAEFGGADTAPASTALHIQLAAADAAALASGDYLAVVNYTLAGFGHFFTRYCKALDPAASALLTRQLRSRFEALRATLGPQQELVEVLSILDNNAQIHPPYTSAQIVPPHEHSGAARSDQLDSASLELAHDVGRDELVLYRRDPVTGVRGGEVLPLYMGFFHPGSMPLHQRLYADLSPTAYIPSGLRPHEFNARALPVAMCDTAPQAVEHFPRLTVGNLVLQRELWSVPVEQLPAIEGDDFEQFCAWIAWADAQQLPPEVFVRCRYAFDNPASVTDVSTLNKPILLDCENPFAWRMVQHLIQPASLHTVLFEEMLPNPRQLWLKLDDQPYVAEFQIELNRGGSDA